MNKTWHDIMRQGLSEDAIDAIYVGHLLLGIWPALKSNLLSQLDSLGKN